jgi:hypothetical protein
MLSLQISNEEEMAKVLQFLHTSRLKFSITDSEKFRQTLYQAIDSERIQPSWVRQPEFQNEVRQIENQLEGEYQQNKDDKEVEQAYKHIKSFTKRAYSKDDTMDTYFKPTDHFKEFCGSECLTAKGLITPNLSVTFIHHQMKIRKIPIMNGVIQTNEWLRSLLEDARSQIYVDELPELVYRLLQIRK